MEPSKRSRRRVADAATQSGRRTRTRLLSYAEKSTRRILERIEAREQTSDQGETAQVEPPARQAEPPAQQAEPPAPPPPPAPPAQPPEPELASEPIQQRDEHRGLLGRIRPAGGEEKGLFVKKPGNCAVCNKSLMVESEEELQNSGWQVSGDVGLCPDCQALGWRLPPGGQLPLRSARSRGPS